MTKEAEGVGTNPTGEYLEQRRSESGYRKAEEAGAGGREPESEKKTEAKPDETTAKALQGVMAELQEMRAERTRAQEKIESLEKDNKKYRDERRKRRAELEEDPEEKPKSKAKADTEDWEERLSGMLEERDKQLMKRLSPLVSTVETMQVGAHINALLSADPRLADDIGRLPDGIRSNLEQHVAKFARAYEPGAGEDPITEGLKFVLYKNGVARSQTDTDELLPPERRGRTGVMDTETDTRKTNREVFGHEWVGSGKGQHEYPIPILGVNKDGG